ncbi:UDP-glucose 4-epimerase GalE [Arthrobacter sp. PAMC25284]|uniref:UDP-glucose 4-epimerase GalE n=1 Tax=Arthrobacter sp. PAMC25284 TaxID=2861279 RepID=UPI001C62F0F5|nr:UDP-glucose 4-epimerase GalE [Arthrobacter sp. PAMC25284]QYF89083.1 UDP-glucose 4-epimerase GalE [Arthrobacter sp. PAMC25284]
MRQQTALVTGGAGFIGSHCSLDLLLNGYDVVVVDNLVNSSSAAIESVRRISGHDVTFYRFDISDQTLLDDVFNRHSIDVVIHFAAYKAVGDSMDRPVEYYSNNLTGLLSLLNAMGTAGVRHLVFSSSCSIYGNATALPITEDSPARPTNPYARSKWMAEQILTDLCARHSDWSVTALRYFNPAGAHESGELGEDPKGVPGNVLPYLSQLAAGRLEELKIFGSDYPTPDGTAVRDYIHVMDVVEGHRLALESGPVPGFRRYNLGTGIGTSVLELVRAFAAVSGQDLAYRLVGRRPGDVSELVASPDRARAELGWSARRDLTTMCEDAWRFQQKNPLGYKGLVDMRGGSR